MEPFFQECRDFVKDYDPNLHTRLSETTIWHEARPSAQSECSLSVQCIRRFMCRCRECLQVAEAAQGPS